MEEREIYLKDLFYRIFAKWRRLVVFMLVGGIVFAGAGCLKSYKNVKSAEQALAAQQAAGGAKEGEQAVSVPEFKPVNTKYIVIGIVVGALADMGIAAIGYAASSKLRYKDDISQMFKVPVLGFLPHYEKYGSDRGLDRVISKAFWKKEYRFSEDERLDMICADIHITLNRADMKKICLVSSAQADEKVMKAVTERIKDEVEVTAFAGPIINSPAELVSMVGYDGVVLVEKTDTSLYEDIQKELDYCARFKVPVIGCIVVG